MKVTKEELPQREMLLTIELEPEDLEPYLERAYRRVVQRTNIPGFRKGKAPRAVVEPFIGRDALREEALEVLLPEVVDRTIEEQHLEPGGTAAFLFFIRPDHPVIRALVSLFVRSFRGAFVDAEAISSLPHLEVMNRCGGGYATLAVFRRPREASPGSSRPG